MSHDQDTLARARSRIGTVLHGKYRLERVLGVGGMAVVYAATHRNGKRLAIKMLHPELSGRRELQARFLREGYVANSVKHPGVVDVLDDDVADDGSAFLVMELLEGAGVEELCEGLTRPLPLPAALVITHQLLDVLAAAHERGVIHRDVKPANLFVRSDGQLKVLDFGIARLRDVGVSQHATRTGAMLGTPAFMAPEQALGEATTVDARTDVWAAGATLFTLLSGELVHPGDNGRQVLVRAATKPARSLGDVSPEIPQAVTAVVTRALEFDRAARWESAAAMRDAIRAVYEDAFGPISVEPARELVAARRRSNELSTLDTGEHQPFDHGHSTTWKPVSAQHTGGTRGGRGWVALAAVTFVVTVGAAAFMSRGEAGSPAAPPAATPAAPSDPATARPASLSDPAPAPPPSTAPPAPVTPAPATTAGSALAAPPAPSGRPSLPRRSERPSSSAPPVATAPPAEPAPSAEPPRRSPLELELQ